MEFLTNTLAQAVMTREVRCVHPHTSMTELLELFVQQGIAAAPVVDSERKIVGFVSQTDIVELDLQVEEYHESRLEETGGYVQDIMVPIETYAYAADPLAVVIDKMCQEKLHRMVVLDEQHHVVGIITTMDVVCALHQAYQASMKA